METRYIKENISYDGSQLTSLWAFKNFLIQGDSLVSFRGKCAVKLDKMVDLADVLANDHIFSEEMLHFIIEFFELDLEKTIYKQRMLITIIKEILEKKAPGEIIRKGDDLFYRQGKLTVSIATLSPVSTLIHTGINLTTDNTPVTTASLKDLGIHDIEKFAEEVMHQYKSELKSIKMARCKVRGVL